MVDQFRPSKVGDPAFTGFIDNKPGYWFSKYGTGEESWVLASDGDIRNSINYWTRDNNPQYPDSSQ
jgi:hypothetical protein